MQTNKLSLSTKIALNDNFKSRLVEGKVHAFITTTKDIDDKLKKIGVLINGKGHSTLFTVLFTPDKLAEITELEEVKYIDIGDVGNIAVPDSNNKTIETTNNKTIETTNNKTIETTNYTVPFAILGVASGLLFSYAKKENSKNTLKITAITLLVSTAVGYYLTENINTSNQEIKGSK